MEKEISIVLKITLCVIDKCKIEGGARKNKRKIKNKDSQEC